MVVPARNNFKPSNNGMEAWMPTKPIPFFSTCPSDAVFAADR